MGYRDYRDYLESVVLPRKCEQHGVDKCEVRMAFAEIEFIGTNAEQVNPYMQMEFFRHLQEFSQWCFPNVLTWGKLVTEILDCIQSDRNKIDTLFMVTYVATSESLYKFVVDWLCCALATTDITSQFAKDTKNCECVSGKELAVKRSYLKDNNLDRIADALDSDIRNAAAHMSFKVKQNGVSIWETANSGNPREEKVIIIGEAYEELRTVALAWYQAIVHFYDVHHGPYKYFQNSTFATEESIVMMERAVLDMVSTSMDLWPGMAQAAEEKFWRAAD